MILKKIREEISLVGIVIISIAAFFGFGKLFSYIETGIGAQALAAAFSALFLILSTNFLMKAQEQSSLKREQNRRVFDESIKVYRAVVFRIVGILEKDKIYSKDVKDFRNELYALTILLGSPGTVKQLGLFIDSILNIMSKENLQDSGLGLHIDLDLQNKKKLWEKAVEFLTEARTALKLNDYYPDKVNKENILNTFTNEEEQIYELKKKENARTQITLDQFKENKDLKPDTIKSLDKILKLLKDKCSLTKKCTKTQISLKSEKSKTNDLYLNVTKNETFNISTNGLLLEEESLFLENIENELNNWFSECKINDSPSKNKDGKIFRNVSFIVTEKQIKAENIEKLNECVQKISKFRIEGKD